MAEERLTKERIDFTIDLLISMAVEELAEDLNKPAVDILPDFIESKTGKLLYDESSKLWWNGPSYIAELYITEKGYK